MVGTPFTDLPCKRDVCIEEGKKGACLEYARQVRKQLSFDEERSPSKKLAPSTPGGARPASLGIIDISDSDSEVDTSHAKKIREVQVLEDCILVGCVGSEKENFSQNSVKQTHYD